MILVLEQDTWIKEDIERIIRNAGLEVSDFESELRHPELPKEVDIVICGLSGRSLEDGTPTWEGVKIVYYATSLGIDSGAQYFQLPRGMKWSPAEWWQKELNEKVLEVIKNLS